MMSKELWVDIQTFEGLYQISSFGKVMSLGNGLSTDTRTKQVRVLKTREATNGYERIKLCKNGKGFHRLVHRLVAIHYIDNPNQYREVNHIDGDKFNNRVDNLEWVTASMNQRHAFRTGLQKVVKGKEHKQSIRIMQKDLDGNLVKIWDSIGEIKRNLGYNSHGIICCCKRRVRYKTAYGYKWEYNV